MDFIDRVKAFAAGIPEKLDIIKTEDATKNFLIMPFIQQILGYNPFDPNDLIPEYDANVGAARKYKLDYAILQDSEPIILIECKCYGVDLQDNKHYSQLFHYFSAVKSARIGILTDGVVYQFFADLDNRHRMDSKPFLVINFLDLNDSAINELAKLTKSAFDVKDAINSASELKYIGGIKSLFREQLKKPNEDFVKYFFKQLCPENVYTGRLKQDFVDYTLRGIKEFITEEMKNLLDDAVNPPDDGKKDQTEEETKQNLETEKSATKFTEEEQEGFYIVRAILSVIVDPKRVTYKDTESYCNILLERNTQRQIVRFYFNNPNNLRLEIYSVDANGNKSAEKVPIKSVNEIYQYADKFKAVVSAYDAKAVAK